MLAAAHFVVAVSCGRVPTDSSGPDAWVVPPGAEFWRRTATSREISLPRGESVGKAGHSLVRIPGGAAAVAPRWRAYVGANGFTFDVAGEHPIQIHTRSVEVGGASIRASDGRRAWQVAGDTAQTPVDEAAQVVEHLVWQDDGLELSWVVRERPARAGAITVQAAVDGLAALRSAGRGLAFLDAAGRVRLTVGEATAVDVAGHRWPLTMRGTSGGLSVEVPADVVATAQFPLAIDPVLSPEFKADEPLPGISAGGAQVACGTLNCLAVWTSDTGFGVMRRVDFTGAPIDAQPTHIGRGPLSVAWAGGVFLVSVTTEAGLSFVRVRENDGVFLGAVAQPRDGFLASNGSLFLLVSAIGTSASVTRIRPDGTILDNPPITIFPGTVNIVLAAGGAGHDFLLAYRTSSGSHAGVAVLRIGDDGTVATATPVLAPTYADVVGGSLSFDGIRWLLAVAVSREDSAINYIRREIYAIRLDPSGAPLDTSPVLVSSPELPAGSTRPAAMSYDGNFLVAWRQDGATPFRLHGKRIDPASAAFVDGSDVDLAGAADLGSGLQFVQHASGVVVQRSVVAGPAGTGRLVGTGASVHLGPMTDMGSSPSRGDWTVTAAGTDVALVAWIYTHPGRVAFRSDVYATRVSLVDGSLLDSAPLLLSGPDEVLRMRPSVAASGNDFVVAWVGANSTAIEARLVRGADGTTAPLVSVPTSSDDASVDVAGFPDGWTMAYTYLRPKAVSVADVTLDGHIDRDVLHACCSGATADMPRVVRVGTSTAVVVVELAGNTAAAKLAYVRYDRRTHTVLDAAPRSFTAGVSGNVYPRAAAVGGAVRVGWLQDSYANPLSIHAAAFDPASATVVQPDTVLVPDATSRLVTPYDGLSLVSDGTESWVLWDDVRTRTGTVRGGLLGTPMTALSTLETFAPSEVSWGPAAASFGDGAFVVAYGRVDPFDGSTRPRVRCFGRAPHPAGADESLILHENATQDILLPADVPASMVEVVQAPAHGTVTASPGKLTYAPAAGYTGPDRLRWRMRNCLGTSATWTVDLTVETWPPAPVAMAGSATTDEDTSVRLVLTASSPSGAPPQFRLATGPAHGTLTAPGLSPTYTPDPDWNGTDTFSWYVDDGFHRSATVDETIVVRPVNDLPTLDPASFTTPADVPLDVHVTAHDPDGDAVTFTLIGLPTHGTLAGSGPDWVYTPDALYVGSDAFTVRPSDPSGPGLARTFALTVTARNHPPAAHAATVGIDQNTAISLTISADDADGDALLFVVTDGPHHGTLTGSAPALTYTPAPEYWGPDAFVFTASDAGATSTARVTIDVRHVNRPPVPRALAVTTDEDVPVALTLAADDADGDALTYTITTAPAHGSLTGTAPGLTYSPSARFFGTDAFSFTVSDGTATVAGRGTVTVRHVNHAPEAEGASHAATEDVTLSFDLAGHDPDGDALTFQVVTPPAHGTVAIDANHVEYTPAPDFHGDDALAFTVSDGTLASAPAQVVLQVASVNDAPVAKDLRVQVVEDDAVAVTLAGTDADGDALFFDILEPPTVGRLTGTAPAVTYLSKPLSRAGDRFRYRAFDGFDWSAPAEVAIVVLPRNHAPFATGASVALDEDGSAAVRLAGTDPDGDALGFEVTQAPAHGTLTGTVPNLTYVPAADFSGSDEVRFVTFDGDLRSTEAIVAITVRPVEDAPVAQGTTVATAEDTPVEIVLAASDVDGDALVPRFVRAPLHGTLEASEAGVVYRPEADFHGPDAFSWVAFDGVRDSVPVEVAIDVAAVNDAPVAAGDALETVSGRAVEVVLAGADVDGDGLTFRVVEPPGHGALSGMPPLVAYAPEADFEGDDVFTFVANDGAVDSAEAQVLVHVGHRNRAPVAVDQALEAFAGEPLAVHLAGSDAEGQGLSFVIVEDPAHGRVEGVPPDVVYVAEADFVGADAFTFTASDGAESSAPGTIRVDVRRRPAPPTPPRVADVVLETRVGTPVEVVLQATGEGAERAVFAIVSEPGHGRASLDGARLTYVPAAAFVGNDGFTYQASVGELRSAPAMVRVRVNPTPAGPPVQVPSGGCGCSGGGGAMAVLGLMGWRRRSRRC